MISLLFGIFIGVVGVQLAYAVFVFSKVKQVQNFHTEKTIPPFSVLICAKNEAQNLKNNLPAILLQQLPAEVEWEVLIVNDASTDDTKQVLSSFQNTYKHLRIITIPEEEERLFPGKKHAWTKGVQQARFSHIICTDADCMPMTKDWLLLMNSAWKGHSLVGAMGAYKSVPNNALNAFIRWETQHTWMQYYSFWKTGFPYMLTGRNMGGTKSFLLEASSHPHFHKLPSGDDDLLIQQLERPNQLFIQSHPAAGTLSSAPETFGEWLAQKKRHVSTGKYYTAKAKFFLALYGFSHGLFWLLFIMLSLLLTGKMLWIFICLSVVRIALYIQIHSFLNSLYKNGLSNWEILKGDFLWSLYNVLLSPYIFLKNKMKWK